MAQLAVIDVTIRDEGTIAQIIPHTTDAREWITENCATESWQWLGGSLCIEPRYAYAIAQGMQDEGLAVELA